mgnify:CR=1 FL=1
MFYNVLFNSLYIFYKISKYKNAISVKINSFDREENTEIYDRNTVPLYVEELNSEDDRTQIELRMCAIEDLNDGRINKEIDLTKLSTLSPQDKELYVLNSNQEKGIKFAADDWELPQFASNKENAMSNFTSSFVFSIKN